MTKSTLFIVFLFLLLRISIGQSLPLELIGSSGAEQQNEISLQWTIGETMVFYNQEENTVSVSEGFHQLFSIDRDLKAEAEVRANVFPNPSFNLFTVEVDNPGAIDYTISNTIGQILRTGIFEREIDINMKNFSSGIYFMTLYTGAKFDKTFSLIKI